MTFGNRETVNDFLPMFFNRMLGCLLSPISSAINGVTNCSEYVLINFDRSSSLSDAWIASHARELNLTSNGNFTPVFSCNNVCAKTPGGVNQL